MTKKVYTWQEVKDTEVQALKRGEFQGMVIQALKDLGTDVGEVNKTLNGNGQPGLIQKVQKLENRIWYISGGIVLGGFALQLLWK